MQNYSVRDPSRFLPSLTNLTFVIASLDSLLFFQNPQKCTNSPFDTLNMPHPLPCVLQ
jgi:hypothetical protein